jgi:hypothetical protein
LRNVGASIKDPGLEKKLNTCPWTKEEHFTKGTVKAMFFDEVFITAETVEKTRVNRIDRGLSG